jgi:hypothetical protein
MISAQAQAIGAHLLGEANHGETFLEALCGRQAARYGDLLEVELCNRAGDDPAGVRVSLECDALLLMPTMPSHCTPCFRSAWDHCSTHRTWRLHRVVGSLPAGANPP